MAPDERRKQSSSEREEKSVHAARVETCGRSANVLRWFIWMPHKDTYSKLVKSSKLGEERVPELCILTKVAQREEIDMFEDPKFLNIDTKPEDTFYAWR